MSPSPQYPIPQVNGYKPKLGGNVREGVGRGDHCILSLTSQGLLVSVGQFWRVAQAEIASKGR